MGWGVVMRRLYKRIPQPTLRRALERDYLLASLASSDCRPENVVVKPIIIAELELCNVKMKIFLADVVEGADDAAFENAPKAINRVGMHRANQVRVHRPQDEV